MGTVSVKALIGRELRRQRVDARVTQDKFASIAREVGLSLSRPALAMMENGQRDVSAEEILLLPRVMAAAFGRDVMLAELFGSDPRQKVELRSGMTMTVGALTAALREPVPRPASAGRVRRRYTGPRDAETVAARALGVPAEEVLQAAQQMWGRSLSEQRDLLVEERVGGVEITPDERRAYRGRATRELLTELSVKLERQGQQLDQTTEMLEQLAAPKRRRRRG